MGMYLACAMCVCGRVYGTVDVCVCVCVCLCVRVWVCACENTIIFCGFSHRLYIEVVYSIIMCITDVYILLAWFLCELLFHFMS